MEKLATIQIMVDSGLFILIWLVQLIIYPSFRYTEEKDFVGWHARYTWVIGAIVSPLMLVQVGIEVVHGAHYNDLAFHFYPVCTLSQNAA